jgi:hypothetical protein
VCLDIESALGVRKIEHCHFRNVVTGQSGLLEASGDLSSLVSSSKAPCSRQVEPLPVSLKKLSIGEVSRRGLNLLYLAPFSLLIFNIHRYSLSFVR